MISEDIFQPTPILIFLKAANPDSQVGNQNPHGLSYSRQRTDPTHSIPRKNQQSELWDKWKFCSITVKHSCCTVLKDYMVSFFFHSVWEKNHLKEEWGCTVGSASGRSGCFLLLHCMEFTHQVMAGMQVYTCRRHQQDTRFKYLSVHKGSGYHLPSACLREM